MANLSNINNKFIVTDGGHVSIGATTTTYPLTVESGGVGTVLRAGTSFVSIDSVGSAASPSLIFNGDSNTGMWRPASDTLGFSTAGVERFKIGTSNALLIGTNYQLKFTTDDGSTQLGKLFDDVGFTVEGKLNNNLNLRSLANSTGEGIKFQNKTGGVLSTHMFIGRLGNITIGNGETGLVFAKLCLSGDPYVITSSGQATGGIDVRSNVNPGAGLYTGGISFGGASNGRAAISGVQGTSTDGDRQGLAFFTHGSASGSADAAEAMRIATDGNVGIGTTSPNNPFTAEAVLQVGDTSTATNDGLITIGSGTTGSGDIYFADGTSGGSAYRGFLSYKHNGDYLAFGTAETTRIIIDSSGNEIIYGGLTVGATSQVAGTQVAIVGGGVTNLQRWGSTSDGGNQASYRFRIDQSYKFIANNGSGDNLVIDSGNGSIIPNGGVYLGGTAAANKLDDYEEGTWTPAVAGVTMNTANGRYTRIGNMVKVYGVIRQSSGTSTSSVITGLPFATSGLSRSPMNFSQINSCSWGSGATMLVSFIYQSQFALYGNANGSALVQTPNNFFSTGSFMEFGGTYMIF